ncbi:MAG: AAA family ATPase [Rikenellaceae bacterium]|jgi:AAA15 family ATPase/GTPase|nr:AAA family ATPase [Rikenellaceae bacterium]
MELLNKLEIENFRGFDSLEIDGLSKLNLFVGKNNSGKTSVLEALFLVFGMSNPTGPHSINALRGMSANVMQQGSNFVLSPQSSKQFAYLFYNLKHDNKPRFKAIFTDKTERELELKALCKQDSLSDLTTMTPASLREINGIGLDFSIKKTNTKRQSYSSSFVIRKSEIITNITKGYTEELHTKFIPSNVTDNNALSQYAETNGQAQRRTAYYRGIESIRQQYR